MTGYFLSYDQAVTRVTMVILVISSNQTRKADACVRPTRVIEPSGQPSAAHGLDIPEIVLSISPAKRAWAMAAMLGMIMMAM
ncbi:MAG: hypothetical protein M1813_009201 [Trichoglossum hirsutum]|nr:MAG: hypothetical protein M1813_009201 [Trichoglossum hirsutum]